MVTTPYKFFHAAEYHKDEVLGCYYGEARGEKE
jgi:hypothetical protein